MRLISVHLMPLSLASQRCNTIWTFCRAPEHLLEKLPGYDRQHRGLVLTAELRWLVTGADRHSLEKRPKVKYPLLTVPRIHPQPCIHSSWFETGDSWRLIFPKSETGWNSGVSASTRCIRSCWYYRMRWLYRAHKDTNGEGWKLVLDYSDLTFRSFLPATAVYGP